MYAIINIIFQDKDSRSGIEAVLLLLIKSNDVVY